MFTTTGVPSSCDRRVLKPAASRSGRASTVVGRRAALGRVHGRRPDRRRRRLPRRRRCTPGSSRSQHAVHEEVVEYLHMVEPDAK